MSSTVQQSSVRGGHVIALSISLIYLTCSHRVFEDMHGNYAKVMLQLDLSIVGGPEHAIVVAVPCSEIRLLMKYN